MEKIDLLLLIWLFIAAANLSITVDSEVLLLEPAPVNATLNSTAVFNCIISESDFILKWRINGVIASALKDKGVRSVENCSTEFKSNKCSTLHVPAIIEFNNSEISCVYVGGSVGLKNSTVTLKVQGLLDPPSNLNITDCPYRLQWDAPFTLDITDVDPDISGYTICSNVTTQCINVTEQFFQFPSLCSPVLFSVSAHNIIGYGAVSTAVYHPNIYNTAVNKHVAVSVYLVAEVSLLNSTIGANISLSLKTDNQTCADYFLLRVVVMHLQSGQTVEDKEIEIFPVVDEIGRLNFTVELTGISHNNIFKLNVTDMSGSIFGLTNFKTHDVKDIIVITSVNTIIITCYFVSGSVAEGCCVTFTASDEGGSLNFSNNGIIEGTTATVSFTDVKEGAYNITVRTLYRNGTCSPEGEILYYYFNVPKEVKTSSMINSSSTSRPTTFDHLPVGSRVTVLAELTATGSLILCLATSVFIVAVVLAVKKRKKKIKPAPKPVTSDVYDDVCQPKPNGPIYEEVKLQNILSPDPLHTFENGHDELKVEKCPAYRASAKL